MQHYNLEQVNAMADGDDEFIREMVKTFLEELPGDIKVFEEAIANENAKMAFQVAHKFKPNLQLFGLNLSGQIKSLEQWSKGELELEDIQYFAKEIALTVENACQEMGQDFKLD